MFGVWILFIIKYRYGYLNNDVDVLLRMLVVVLLYIVMYDSVVGICVDGVLVV